MPQQLSQIEVQNEIGARFRALPQALRDFLASDEIASAILKIESQYRLSHQATAKLSRLIGMLTLKLLSSQEFIAEISKIAPQGKLNDMKRDIVIGIFAPHEKILNAHAVHFETLQTIVVEAPTLAKIMPQPPAPMSQQIPPRAISPLAQTSAPSQTGTLSKPPQPTPVSTQPAPTAPSAPILPAPAIIPPKPSSIPFTAITSRIEPIAPANQPTTAPYRPINVSKITITSRQPGMPAQTPYTGAQRAQAEVFPRPIRYTTPPVIREVPQIIPPSGLASQTSRIAEISPQTSLRKPTFPQQVAGPQITTAPAPATAPVPAHAPTPVFAPAPVPAPIIPKIAIQPQPIRQNYDAKQQESIIDLSTFQVIKNAPPAPNASPQAQTRPSAQTGGQPGQLPQQKGNILNLRQ